MKKTIIMLTTLALAGAVMAVSPSIKKYVKVKADAAEASAAVTATSLLAQVDTNVTTTATNYTADAVGQLLIGSAGSGTNAVWVATVSGSATNWVQITVTSE